MSWVHVLERIYGGSTAVLQFAGSWILLTTAGEPTPTSRT